MIFNYFSEIEDKKFDFIIVGSGPAGISLALELENYKISSLILEAGKDNFSDESQSFYKGSIIGDEYPPLKVTRLRQFGGSSGHWGGVCRSLDDHDFVNWPIKKKDLDIYANKAKNIINLKRNNFYKKKFNNNFDLVRFEVSPLRFKDKYKADIKNSDYIHLLMDAYVIKLEGNKKINEIFFYQNNKYFSLKSKYFILACGGIENSRLMHLVRKNNPKLLDPKMPIGHYFLEHPYNYIGDAFIDIKNFNNFLKNKSLENSIKLNCDWWFALASNQKFVKENNILDSVMFIKTVYTNINIKNKNFIEKLKCVAPEYIRKILVKESEGIISFGISSQTSQEVDFDNKIVLDENKKDTSGIDMVALHWKKNEKVRKTYKKNIEALGGFFIDEELGRVAVEEFIYSNKSFIHQGGGHHMGGTRIGLNSFDSVVDKNLKVHGVENLFITGSSVFASAGYANPTFTIIQLSVRLAEYFSRNK